MAIEIKAADVMKLRKMTGAGMMDCKKALVDSEGDFERAKEIIKEKGKLVAAKRADRETSEGSVIANTAHISTVISAMRSPFSHGFVFEPSCSPSYRHRSSYATSLHQLP